jgi:hypothetical protein
VGIVASRPDPILAGSRRTREFQDSFWWQTPGALLDRFPRSADSPEFCDWYLVVDALLGIESEDLRFRRRFAQLYGEFVSSPHQFHGVQRLNCRVQVIERMPAHLVTFTASKEAGIVDFILDVYRDRGYVEMHDVPEGWRCIGLAGADRPLLAANGSYVFVSASQPWQELIATCATNWVMRMQRETLFFHAATVGIGDAGVLIAGGKGAGKSTLSMALGARGHTFLGDEVAAVRTKTLEVCQFRRAVSIRPGPQSPWVEKVLKDRPTVTEQFPDGTTRRRAAVQDLFPHRHQRSVPLRWVFFLRGFDQNPRAEAFTPRTSDLGLLTPMPGTLWGVSPAKLLVQVAQLLSKVNCCFLRPGLPEETAELVERIVRTG